MAGEGGEKFINMLEKRQRRIRRHKRIKAKIIGTGDVPRLCVFRSSKHIYAQLVNDEKGKIIISAKDSELKKTRAKTKKEEGKEELTGKKEIAFEVGKLAAEIALKEKIEKVVFDRGGYQYHGRVKALAEGARSAGLKF